MARQTLQLQVHPVMDTTYLLEKYSIRSVETDCQMQHLYSQPLAMPSLRDQGERRAKPTPQSV